jgi:hypothetical protein
MQVAVGNGIIVIVTEFMAVLIPVDAVEILILMSTDQE